MEKQIGRRAFTFKALAALLAGVAVTAVASDAQAQRGAGGGFGGRMNRRMERRQRRRGRRMMRRSMRG